MKIRTTLFVAVLSTLTGLNSFAQTSRDFECPLSGTSAFKAVLQKNKAQAEKCLKEELQQTLEDIQNQQEWINAELQKSELSEDEKLQLEKDFYQSQVSKEDESSRIDLLLQDLSNQ